MMQNLHPTKQDRIRDKLLGIESLAYQARHLTLEEQDKLLRGIRLIGAAYNELWIMLNTSEEKGREWQWWE